MLCDVVVVDVDEDVQVRFGHVAKENDDELADE